MNTSQSSIPPDTLLAGKIRLVKRIGRGGMGDVWVARNEATQAELAVKTLGRGERTPANDERFRREARLAATISHRNVVRVFDLVDEADGTLGLVMELLRGGTLEDLLAERGRLTTHEAIAVALPILSALQHVHQKGIVHRDVKPANVFFAVEPDGHVIPKLLDFGIAKLPAAGSALTVDGNVLGTPHYMSPEQIRAKEDIDGRSDLFSFAVVLYEMLTGVRVFAHDTAGASLAAVLEHEVDPDMRIEPRIWLALSRAFAKRPYERYATCADFAEALKSAAGATDEDLAQALQDLRPRTPPSSTMESTSMALTNAHLRAPAQRSTLTIGIVAAVVAAVTATGLTVFLTRPAATPPFVAAPTMPLPAVSSVPAAVPVAAPEPAPELSAEPAPIPHATAIAKKPAPSAAVASTASASPAPAPSPKPHGRGSVATTPGF